MDSPKKISIYVRNKEITPSSYYRIVQYARYFDGNVLIRETAPKKIYKKHLNSNKSNFIIRFFFGVIYYCVMVVRSSYYLFLDIIKKPDFIIVSKTFCPQYTPLLLKALICIATKNTILYWDFDDNIFLSKEISKYQARMLEKHSFRIVVTNQFLRDKIEIRYRDKVIMLPTTDGDFRGLDEESLRQKRKSSLGERIKLVWVATASNLPSLLNIIHFLDQAAEELKKYDKQLELAVVCNAPLTYQTEHLLIRNIKWTREIAKEEICNAHVGIMPLLYSEYALGKGGFKLVQYIATGLPVIASKVGFNVEVVGNDNGILVDDKDEKSGWIGAILKMANSYENWEKYSINACQSWKAHFSFEYNLGVWESLLTQKGEVLENGKTGHNRFHANVQ